MADHRALALSRREMMVGAAGALTAGALPRSVRAAAGCDEVVVATWGGDYQRLLIANVEQPLLKPQKIEVLHDLSTPTVRMTKLRSERNSKTGTLDVVHLGGEDIFQMGKEGTLAELSAAEIPNLKFRSPAFQDPYSIAHIYSAQVVVYNPEKVSPVPDSYGAFWDPRYKGRVGIMKNLHIYWLEIAALLNGGTKTDYEPGKAALLDLKKNEPRIYPSQEALAAGLKNGEVWLAPNWRARAVLWAKAGIPVKSATPREGARIYVSAAGIAKNAAHRPCAAAYLNAMLDPAAQIQFARNMSYLPTVTNAKLPDDLEAQIGFTEAEQKSFFSPDQDYIGSKNAEWLEWWDKNFLA